jgi:beta-carotene 3-hydroxylase
MHHKHLDQQDGESFGMLLVHKKYWKKVWNDRKLKTLSPTSAGATGWRNSITDQRADV